MKLYVSTDDGALYKEDEIDPSILEDEDYFWPVEIPNTFTLKAEQLLGNYGNLMEILLRAKIAKKL